MWAPDKVVKQHKRRANILWVALLVLILSYAVWIFIKTYKRRKNPSINLRLEADRYTYPTLTVCMLGVSDAAGYGCDYESFNCAYNATAVVASVQGFADPTNVTLVYQNQIYPDVCIDINLGDLEEIDDEDGLTPAYAQLLVFWQTSPPLEEVPGYADSVVAEISSSAFVFMSDPSLESPLGDHSMSTFIGDVPYTRIESGVLQERFSYATTMMEMTETSDLFGKSTRHYSAASITTSDYWIPGGFFGNATLDHGIGTMFLDIYQPRFSHTIRKAVDPLEPLELLGNIGGMWELLLIMWGLAFIAVGEEGPNLKGRNFKKTARKGIRAVQSVTVRGKPGSGSDEGDFSRDEVPTWERMAPGTGQELPSTVPALNPNPDGAAPPTRVAWGSAAAPSGRRRTKYKFFGKRARLGAQGRVEQDVDNSSINVNGSSSISVGGGGRCGRGGGAGTSALSTVDACLSPSSRKPIELPTFTRQPPSYSMCTSTAAAFTRESYNGDHVDQGRKDSRSRSKENIATSCAAGLVPVSVSAQSAAEPHEESAPPPSSEALSPRSRTLGQRAIPTSTKRPSSRPASTT